MGLAPSLVPVNKCKRVSTDKAQNFLTQRFALTGLGTVNEENTPGDLLHLADGLVEFALVGNGLRQGVELRLR